MIFQSVVRIRGGKILRLGNNIIERAVLIAAFMMEPRDGGIGRKISHTRQIDTRGRATMPEGCISATRGATVTLPEGAAP